MGWFEEGGTGSPVDVAALLDGTGMVEAMAELAHLGALVSFGTTSDGGALGVTVTLDGRWRRQYGRDPADFTEFLSGAVEACQAAVNARPASPAPRQRQRRPRGG